MLMQSELKPLFNNTSIDIERVRRILENIKECKDPRDRTKLKRMLRGLFDEIDYEIFRRFPINEKTEISVVDNEYIFLAYRSSRRTKRRWKEYVEVARRAVIGFDSTRGKLFINLINFDLRQRDFLGFKYHINEVKDRLYELLDKEEVVRVRIQGDVIFSIWPFSPRDVERIRSIILYELTHNLNTAMARRIADALRAYLNKLRISANTRTAVSGDKITIEIAADITKTSAGKKYELAMKHVIDKFIESNIDIQSMFNVYDVHCSYYNGFSGSFISCSILMRSREDVYNKILNIDNVVRELLNNTSRHTLVYGNHIIEWTGLPNTFTVSVDVGFTTVTDDIAIDRSIPTIIATEGEIVIRHDEHGEEVIKVERPIVISVSSTAVSLRDSEIRNRAVLDMIFKNMPQTTPQQNT